jgi:uncharacterized protein
MIVGPVVNGGAIVVGALMGAVLGERVPERLRVSLPLVFGCSAMGLGVALIVKVTYLPPVILAIILGVIVGELLLIEPAIQKAAGWTRTLIERGRGGEGDEEFLNRFVSLLVLFCASGTGIFGALNEGMTGDPSMLIAKSILDLFTGAIFAISLGMTVAALAVPQFLIQAALFAAATAILPLTTPAMIGDFSACGGLIMLATGLRMCGIKTFPTAAMLPGLVIVMPLSGLWAAYATG